MHAKRPANENPSNEFVQVVDLGRALGATMDSITARAVREKWTGEQYQQAINTALFGGANA